MSDYLKITEQILREANCLPHEGSKKENLGEEQKKFIANILTQLPVDNYYVYPKKNILFVGDSKAFPVAQNLFINILRHRRKGYAVSHDELNDDIKNGFIINEKPAWEFYTNWHCLFIFGVRFKSNKWVTDMEKVILERWYRNKWTMIQAWGDVSEIECDESVIQIIEESYETVRVCKA